MTLIGTRPRSEEAQKMHISEKPEAVEEFVCPRLRAEALWHASTCGLLPRIFPLHHSRLVVKYPLAFGAFLSSCCFAVLCVLALCAMFHQRPRRIQKCPPVFGDSIEGTGQEAEGGRRISVGYGPGEVPE